MAFPRTIFQMPPLTIGLMQFGDPADPGAWSGIPAGITGGLTGLGASVVRLGLPEPGALERAAAHLAAPRYVGLARREGKRASDLAQLGFVVSAMRARSLVRAAQAAAAEVDAFLLVGGGPSPPASHPHAIFEDATLLQVRRENAFVRELPTRGLRRRAETKRRNYERAKAVCMTTPWAKRSVVEEFGIDPGCVHVVGIGRNRELPAVDRSWWPPRFLFVGTSWRRKSGPLLLRAFARLREDVPGARLDLVGRHSHVEQPGVADHGYLPLGDAGAQELLRALYAEATCLAVPASFDASPIASVEAGAAGIPSIVAATGGASFLLGEGGRYVEADDEDGLLGALRELADPEVAEAAGAIALERSRLFTWPLVAERILYALDLPGVDRSRLARPLG
jgi:glycosyltransferase involved in cell wall biosynthesis